MSRLIGAPPGYVGFDQGGLLTEAIAKHPHCVLLLDEIEKAHPDVFNLLLQVMDHGTLTDNNGRKADFRHVIIVMTTNAGAHEMSRASIGFMQSDNASDGMEAIKRLFSPEFRNRLDAVIQFAPLDCRYDRARGRQAASSKSKRSSRRRACQIIARRRRAPLARGEGLRPEDGCAPDGAAHPGAHQAAARRGAAVRQARRWRHGADRSVATARSSKLDDDPGRDARTASHACNRVAAPTTPRPDAAAVSPLCRDAMGSPSMATGRGRRFGPWSDRTASSPR